MPPKAKKAPKRRRSSRGQHVKRAWSPMPFQTKYGQTPAVVAQAPAVVLPVAALPVVVAPVAQQFPEKKLPTSATLHLPEGMTTNWRRWTRDQVKAFYHEVLGTDDGAPFVHGRHLESFLLRGAAKLTENNHQKVIRALNKVINTHNGY